MDILLKNAYAFIGGKIEKTDIGITGNVFSHIGHTDERADTVIDCSRLLVVPAFVNTHTHAYMSLFRSAADDLPFSEWLFGRVMPMEDNTTSDDAYWGTMLSIVEMIKSGTGTFCDMHMFPFVSANCALKSGMRACITRGLSGSDSIDGGTRRINEAREEISRFKNEKRLTFMAAPHSIYTCDKKYLYEIMRFASDEGLNISIHLSESVTELNDCLKNNGCTPVKYLESIGMLDFKTLAAHCVQLNDEDIGILKRHSVSVSTNPKSNLKLGNGIAPIKKLMDAGVNVCIGTDGASSNNSLDMISEMNFAALLQKGISGDASAFSAAEALKAATENGASALSLNTGIIKEGCLADAALINIDTPWFTPNTNLLASLCYSASGRDVDTLIVDGKILMEKRRLKTLDEEEIIYNCNKISERLVK